ncbi:MAG: HAD-IIIA family hydrolase [Deltaproteobacteria bacterium]|nr:HAD-IIIA family hydrolase [Deltaproteobacteria bacterium]
MRAPRRGAPRARLMPAVFVDRDGTLNHERHYLRRVADLRLVGGAARAVRRLDAAGFAVVVVTNQSGVARGLVPPRTLARIHDAIVRRLGRAGAQLTAIYVCPHHPTVGAPPFRRRCRCRKPRPGLVERAARELGLDLARSYCVGDGAVDLGLAAATRTRGVLVRTGHGRVTETALPPDVPIAHVAANFRAAADWIIEDARRAPPQRRRASAERRRASATRARASVEGRRRPRR